MLSHSRDISYTKDSRKLEASSQLSYKQNKKVSVALIQIKVAIVINFTLHSRKSYETQVSSGLLLNSSWKLLGKRTINFEDDKFRTISFDLALDQLIIPFWYFSLFSSLVYSMMYWYCKEKFCLWWSNKDTKRNFFVNLLWCWQVFVCRSKYRTIFPWQFWSFTSISL